MDLARHGTMALWLGLGVVLAHVRGLNAADLKCQISYPPENAIVRGDVPIFGLADAPRFKHYRVEYGPGTKPDKWTLVTLSRTPQPEDPYTAGKVRWDPNKGAKGNLVTWPTGMTEYLYGAKYDVNLNGVYTVRLVVEDEGGKSEEHRVTLVVGRAVTLQTGGRPVSPDNRVQLTIPPWGSPAGFQPMAILPSTEVKPGPGLIPVGSIYEFRPPHFRFAKPATLTMAYTDAELKGTPLEKVG
ncbi:MAG: hypothetical protein FJ272_21820, partial [Planctomycetes bacterium]|nr:hypothetical protein [Planctomycetota bacterium]